MGKEAHEDGASAVIVGESELPVQLLLYVRNRKVAHMHFIELLLLFFCF